MNPVVITNTVFSKSFMIAEMTTPAKTSLATSMKNFPNSFLIIENLDSAETPSQRKSIFSYKPNYRVSLCKSLFMRTKEEYVALLRDYFLNKAKAYGVVRMALFGSVARGECTESSDIDVAYEGKADILLRCRIKQELEALFGCEVDVVRLRKRLEGTAFLRDISKDLLYV